MIDKHILIVEDNVPINKLFCKNLVANGFACQGVFRVDEAIQSLQSCAFDAIVLDFELPDGYGIQIIDHLNQHRMNIPTVVVSASTRVLELKHYRQHHLVKDILVKPVSPRQLSTVMYNILFQPHYRAVNL